MVDDTDLKLLRGTQVWQSKQVEPKYDNQRERGPKVWQIESVDPKSDRYRVEVWESEKEQNQSVIVLWSEWNQSLKVREREHMCDGQSERVEPSLTEKVSWTQEMWQTERAEPKCDR